MNNIILNNNEILYIFVLAGGHNDNGKCNSFVKQRLDLAIEIYNKYKNKCKIICMGGGTYHKPPILNKLNYVIHESTTCAYYLCKNNVKEDDIYREWGSYDTIANGFFAFTNFILPLKIKNMVLITSQFHMKRSKEIFNYFINHCLYKINIHYLESSNELIKKDVLEERIKRENESLNNFINNISQMSLEEFTNWFYTKHSAYKSIVHYYPLDNNLSSTY
jgi:hypothetical protein